MTASRFFAYECRSCGLRFPAEPEQLPNESCPRCQSKLSKGTPYQVQIVPPQLSPKPTRRVVALLDNIRSAYNVGVMLRTADGCGVEQVVLCGTTATPAHRRVAKTALGAEDRIAWRYTANSLDAAQHLKRLGYSLYALEGGEAAQNVQSLDSDDATVCLIVGNEIAGVDPDLLALCERTVAIPMRGYKQSLNVAVAFGIACYALLA